MKTQSTDGMRMVNAPNARYLRCEENRVLSTLEVLSVVKAAATAEYKVRWENQRQRRQPQYSYFIRNRGIGFTQRKKENQKNYSSSK